MTGVALPINASSGSPSYDARAFRAAMAGLKYWDGIALAGRQGIRPMGGTAANIVTLSGSTITVNRHAGEITPAWAATTGSYDVAMTVAETAALTPADATNARKDIVVGRVYDNDESASGLRLYRAEYLAGTPGPTPAEQSVPQGAIKLATIDVPFLGNGSPVVTNNYTFTVAAGGILPVRSQAERDALVTPATGQWVDRMDKGWPERYDGAVWRTHRLVVSPGTLSDITNPATKQCAFHTATEGFSVWDGTAWLPQTVTAELHQTTTQNVLHATPTPISFQTEIQDSHNGHSTTVNISRWTCPRAGVYDFDGSIAYASNNAGYRLTQWRVNGAILNAGQLTLPPTPSANTVMPAKSMQLTLALNDYVELYGQHNAGSTIATVVSGPDQSTMTAKWVRQP